MANESTRIHTPADQTPAVTNKVAKCVVCGVTWAVQGDWSSKIGCSFCDAPPEAVIVQSEAPGYDGVVIG